VLVAVHDRFARPVASAMADTGTDVKPLIRAFRSKITRGLAFMSYTVTTERHRRRDRAAAVAQRERSRAASCQMMLAHAAFVPAFLDR
jgi:hypothetical protein